MDYNNQSDMKFSTCGQLGLNAAGPADVNSTAMFKGEVCNEVVIGNRAREVAPGIYKKPNLLTVERYLERPFLFDSFVLDNNTYTRDLVASDFSQMSVRLRGTVGFRTTIRLRFQVVGTPFVSGLYRFAFSPLTSRYRSDAWGANITKATQLPGVNINLHDTTEVQLVIPYTHFRDFLPSHNNDWTTRDIYGTVWLFPILPINSATGGAGVRANIWMSFEDVEVEGATQGDRVQAILQAGESAPAVEQQCVDEHSCVASAVPSAKTMVSAVSPSLSAVVGTAAWAVRKAAGFASAMGYSKPNTMKTIKYVRSTKYITNNADVQDCLPSIATHAYNSTDLIHASPNDVDEMAIRNFVARPAVVGFFDFKKTDAAGGLNYFAHVTPYSAFMTTLTSNQGTDKNLIAAAVPWSSANDDIVPSPLFYMANLFTLWRGTIRFRFDLAKTKFHAGRLRVTYMPSNIFQSNTLANTLVPSVANGAPMFGKSVIWDIRESTYLEFDCPYEYSSYYTPFQQYTAVLAVNVVDPLVAPDMVDNFIGCAVSMSGGPDIQFANPVGPQFQPYATPATIPTLLKEEGVNNDQASAFVNVEAPDVVLHGPALYDADLTTQDDKGEERAIGEAITSIKQLVQRPSYSIITQQVSTNPAYTITLPTRAALDATYISWLSYFNHCFAFARGGSRYQIIANGQTTKMYATLDARGMVGNLGQGGSYMALYQGDYNNPLQFSLPYLSMNSRDLCGYCRLTSYTGFWDTVYTNRAVINPASGTATTALGDRIVATVSAGEDWQYFFQLPCPALRGGGSTAATATSLAIAAAFYSAYQA